MVVCMGRHPNPHVSTRQKATMQQLEVVLKTIRLVINADPNWGLMATGALVEGHKLHRHFLLEYV